MEDEFYVPEEGNIGVQSTRNKQASDRMGHHPNRDRAVIGAVERSNEAAYKTYRDLLDTDVPRELARCVLPVSTYTRFYGTVDLSNLFKFLYERLDEHAQPEIRVYAEAIVELIAPTVPIALECFQRSRLC